MKVVLATVVIFLILVGAFGGAYGLSLTAIGKSDRQWCDTLTALTAQPVPKPANPAQTPSREQNYVFYVNLVKLKSRFGC